MTRADRIAALKRISRERILVLDGSWGVMFQREGLEEADFRGERFAHHNSPLKGDNDLLCLTRPDLVTKLHDAYFAAGADISETNTFNATTISQSDYGARGRGGRHQPRSRAPRPRGRRPLDGRRAAQAPLPRRRHRPAQPHPLHQPDVNDPGARSVTFQEVYEAYASRPAPCTRAASTCS